MPYKRFQDKRDSASGQAMVEFVVGLVGMLVLFAFIVQFGSIGVKHSQAMIDAREKAGQDAMSDDYSLAMPGPEFIETWERGRDERAYSQDDEMVVGSDAFIRDDILKHAKPGDLAGFVADNRINRLNSGNTLEEFGLVHGNELSESVPLMPVIRHLLFDTPSIEIEADVYMIWTKGIY